MNYNTMTIESLSDNVFRQSEFKVNKADLIERITYLIEQAKTKQLILSGVVNCVFVVTERDNYGEQLFKDVFENKEQAIEFLAKDGLWESNIHEINEIELN